MEEAIVLTRSEISVYKLILTPYSPLYLFVVHLWTTVSQHLIWVRFLGVLLGLVALLASPHFMRSMGGTHALHGAMWILATSPFLIDQVRMLAPSQLALIVVSLSYICFYEYTRAGHWRWLCGWMIAVMAAMVVHGGLYYVAVVHIITMALYQERFKTRLRNWWLAQLPPLALFSLLFGAQFNRFFADRISEFSTVYSAASQWGRLGTKLSMPWNAIAAILVLVLLLSGLKCCGDWRKDPRHGMLVLGFAIPVMIWLIWLPHDFYALSALPCMAVLASMGIRQYPKWARQLLWTAIAITYGWSHWKLL
tara:strand:- start:1689 stop:2612 length:924 start_codon:yes stop_codon:yes gene_type:complete